MGRLPVGVTAEAAETLLPGDGSAALETLCEFGLAFDAGGRVGMLAPVREHAANREATLEPLDRLTARWLGLAREDGPKIGGPDGASAVARLSAEWANLESALELAMAKAPREGIDAAIALTKFIGWTGIGTHAVVMRGAALARELGDTYRTANCIRCLGDLALWRSEHEQAEQRYADAQSIFQRLGDMQGQANCILGLGEIAYRYSDHDKAREHYRAAILLFQQTGDMLGAANGIKGLGNIARACSEHGRARNYIKAALIRYRKSGDILGEANCISTLAEIALARSQHDEAYNRFSEASELYRQTGDLLGEANCVNGLIPAALSDDLCQS